MKHRSYNVLGNVAIVNFPKDFKANDKKKFALKIMKANKSVETVLEKVGKVRGRLRKISTKHVAGKKSKEVLYKENNCVFRFNVDTTYFSPRLSNERKELAGKIKKNENVLVLFAGVAPLPIVIAKNSGAKKVFSVEINREANKYAKQNVEMNKLKNKVEVVQGDVKKLVEKLDSYTLPTASPSTTPKKRLHQKLFRPKFDVIIMPRPKLKDTFLKQAFALSKKNTRIYYYDFCQRNEINSVVEKIKDEAKKSKKKIKVLKKKVAGEIAPYEVRVRIDFKII